MASQNVAVVVAILAHRLVSSTRIPYTSNVDEEAVTPGYQDATSESMVYIDDRERGTNGTPPEVLENHYHSVHLAKWNYEYVVEPLITAVYALFVGLAKVGFHHTKFVSSWLPESALLIIIGGIMGGISYAFDHPFGHHRFNSRTFFLFLLPPIILEAAFSLHDRTFTNNLGSILVYAVVGTLLNTFIVGPLLYAFSFTGAYGDGYMITITQCLVFSALISAVDPVAVLAIFEDVQVNNILYFLVFGESLLNDAITVVLYNMMNSYATMTTVPVSEIFLGIGSFVTVSLGAVIVGTLVGVLTAVFTKFTDQVRVVEPLALLGMAFMSYLLAELFHFSGIISIICCGLVQKEYAFGNVSRKSNTTVTYFTKMMATTTEAIIFLQLGGVFWSHEGHDFNAGFIIITIILISLSRGLITLGLTKILNRYRTAKIKLKEQFIMSYGGLRGAVAFGLVVLLDEKYLPMRNMMITTTIIVVIFTVFIQGGTIKPLVGLMNIRLSEENEESLSTTIHKNVVDYMMAGIEEIAGQRGDNYLRVLTEKYAAKTLKKWLQKNPTSFDTQVMATFAKISLKDHQEHIYKVSSGVSSKNILAQRFPSSMITDSSEAPLPISTHFAIDMPEDSNNVHTPMMAKKHFEANSEEFRKLLCRNPGTELHRTCDKNLIEDDKHDLAELMQLRNKRHAMLRQRVQSKAKGTPHMRRMCSLTKQSAMDVDTEEENDD